MEQPGTTTSEGRLGPVKGLVNPGGNNHSTLPIPKASSILDLLLVANTLQSTPFATVLLFVLNFYSQPLISPTRYTPHSLSVVAWRCCYILQLWHISALRHNVHLIFGARGANSFIQSITLQIFHY